MKNKLETLRDWLKSECNLDYTTKQLKELEKLDLSFKNLTQIHEDIGLLTNLNILYLCGNQLTSVPESLGNLKNLNILYLDNNQLKSVPKSLLKLKLNYFICDKVFVRESDSKMIKFLKKHWQEYQIVQETLLTDTLI